jgi:hypothetical protein
MWHIHSNNKKGKRMSKFLTTTALVLVAGSAMAADIGAEITVDIEENAAGNWGATTSFDLGLSAEFGAGRMDFVVDADGDVALDEYSIGTSIAGATLSFGDQGNAWISSEDGATLADPAMEESFMVSAQGATMAFGWTDIGADVTDLANVQGKYGMSMMNGMAHVEAAGDYNFNTEEYVFGGRVDAFLSESLSAGGAVTYGSSDETIGFEVDATVAGITAYLNGDQDDMAQNVGGSYTYDLNGVELGAGVNYNIDTEEMKPTAMIGFAF